MTLRTQFDQWRDSVTEAWCGVKVSGFGDVQIAPKEEGRRRLDWGAFELDLEGRLHANLDAAVAVVTTRDATQLAVGYLDFHPFGGTIAPRGRLAVEKGFHIQLGRFDVPFGSDWQFFASKDSVSISRPMTTDAIMDGGYNDVGVRVLGNTGVVNFNTFLLQGLGGGRLLGGRFGFTPFENPFSLKDNRARKVAEAGVSLLVETGHPRRNRDQAWAVDLEGHWGEYGVRAEYVWRRREPIVGEGETTQSGWHLTQELALPALPWPTRVFLRYDQSRDRLLAGGLGTDRDERLAVGASLDWAGFLQLKVEWQHRLSATAATQETPGYSQNVGLAQLVVVF